MSWLRFFRRSQADAELQEEIDAYLAEETAENIARGVKPEEARRKARIMLGNPRSVRETLWRQNTVSLVDTLGRDLKYAARTLARSPGFSLIAVIVMALCIGATTSLFTVVCSVLLRPLPFRDPGRLVMLFEHPRNARSNREGFSYNPVSPADYFEWRAQTHGFEDMAVWRWSRFNLTGERGELPELVIACGGSWNLFPLLGVQAAIGRTFTESEDRSDGNAVMLTWNLFERRFGGDPAIVGRQIHLDAKPFTVVGVLPKWFTYPDATLQLWVPYAAGLPPELLASHDRHFSHVVARLRPDVSLASAMSQVGAVQYRLHLQYLNAPVAEDVASKTINDDLAREVKKPLLILMCAVACMLLIGCLNVANLLVARGAARQKEVAIRGALGAQRLALIRAQLTESLLICLAGGASGVLLSLAATKWLAGAWQDLPNAEVIHVDGVVLGFACALVFLAALLAGLLPAISSTGKAALAALQASSRTTSGNVSRAALRKTLLTVEIAVTVVLLIGAGLLLRSFVRLRGANVGCVTNNVLTLDLNLPAQKYGSPQKLNAFNETLLEKLRAMPGIRAVALGSNLPGEGFGSDDDFTIKEHPPLKPGEGIPDALARWADPGYFSALQIPLLSGRFFTSDDRLDRARKVLVSSLFARQYFPGKNPVGRTILVLDQNNADYEIIGVVGDTPWQVGQPIRPIMYFPILGGGSEEGQSLAIRTDSDPLAMSVPVQKQIAALDPELPVSNVQTMQQAIGDSLGNARFSAALVLGFAVLSLVLASVGLYGVLSYLMAQRTTELGVRMALGAQRDQLLRLILFDGMRPAIIGLAIGSAASAGITQLIRSMLYDTRPLDPAVYIAVIFTLLMVATLACMIPAWQASRLNPMQALRAE
ncbi:MAG: efflux transporter, macrolide exporter (MacB) family, permease protein [Acidobacteriaceae bacterium]|nr:efflux transporter, macrolide exporter (MacB) family, permease protein [Acidobacteriaceae bacterium]